MEFLGRQTTRNRSTLISTCRDTCANCKMTNRSPFEIFVERVGMDNRDISSQTRSAIESRATKVSYYEIILLRQPLFPELRDTHWRGPIIPRTNKRYVRKTKALPDSGSKFNRDAYPCKQLLHPRERIRYFLASVAAGTFARFDGDRRDKRRQKYQREVVAETRQRVTGAVTPKITNRRSDGFIQICTGTCSIGHVHPSRRRAIVQINVQPAVLTLFLSAERRHFCNIANRSRWYLVCSSPSFPEINSLFSDCSPARYALPKSRGERTSAILLIMRLSRKIHYKKLHSVVDIRSQFLFQDRSLQ